MMKTNYLDLSLEEIHELLKTKKIKVKDLLDECFLRIEETKDLNAYITLDKENAYKKAEELDSKEVDDNLLFGIPIAIKDNILTKDVLTTAASHILDNFYPQFDAHVVDLIKKKDMVIIGKTNMDEFAMGSTNETSYYGKVLNPYDKTKVPGGSSGGSAVAVASKTAIFSLGSDTGGSVRQPASFCNIVGLKPTYGRVSRFGLIAFSSSLDQIGPMSRNVYENAVLLNILVDKDERDLTHHKIKEDFTSLIGEGIKGLKVAIPRTYMSDKISENIRNRFRQIVSLLEEKGVQVDYVDISHLEEAMTLYKIIGMGEASTNLARFDGIRYGLSVDGDYSSEEYVKKVRNLGFGEEVKKRIMIGCHILSGVNAKKYYHKALVIRNEMTNSFKNIFEYYDLIISPMTSTSAYSFNDKEDHDFDDVLAIPVNMAGLPAISIPISKENLPYGMQIIADSFKEAKIYQLAYAIEKMIGEENV